MGDFEGRIRPLLRFSWMNASISDCSLGARGYTLQLDAFDPGTSSMAWSQIFRSGSRSNDDFEKRSSKSWKCVGTDSAKVFGCEFL